MADNLKLESILRSLPNEPGVYIMKDKSGGTIYIGKASSLKKRVSSYFRKSNVDGKTASLIKALADIESIVTDSETEALLLEINLVKKHKPRYNVRLKDDKRYPFIAITLDEEYPRAIFTRDKTHQEYRYFGPYTDARAARRLVSTINTIFKLKTCTKSLPLKKNERPCLNYQMKLCQGVCSDETTKEEYRELIENAIQFLNGKIEPVLKNLRSIMQARSNAYEFEKAARIRDIIYDIQKLYQSQKVYVQITEDQDYIVLSAAYYEAIILLFEFRNGAMLGSKISVFETSGISEPDEIIRSFLTDYYSINEAPGKILIEKPMPDKRVLEEYLSKTWSRKVFITTAVTPENKSLFAMMHKNITAIQTTRGTLAQDEATRTGLSELQEILKLRALPSVIECFDISHLHGSDSVASMVLFRDGKPEKSEYRRYKIRGHEGINDPAMIHEVVSRRIQYLVNEGLDMPDIMIIDGGIPQLSRAREAVKNFNTEVRVISIAKKNEEIYDGVSPQPLTLPKSSNALKIVQQTRDEAHRFALTYQRTLRTKRYTKSGLDSIPSIGSKTKSILLSHFSSVDAIKNANEEELKSVPGIGAKTAKLIYTYFHGEKNNHGD